MSAEAFLGGIVSAIKNSKNAISSFQDLKHDKSILNELEGKVEKGRSK